MPHVFIELTRSKALIEDSIGDCIRSFAYPHGYSSPHVRSLTAEAGYDSAISVRNMLSHHADDNFRLARLMLMSDTKVDDVIGWLNGSNVELAHSRDSTKMLAWRAYRRGKSLMTGTPGTDYP